MATTSKAQLRAVAKYEAENVVRVFLKLNKKTDAEILARLEKEPSKQGFIKACILEHMRREQKKTSE